MRQVVAVRAANDWAMRLCGRQRPPALDHSASQYPISGGRRRLRLACGEVAPFAGLILSPTTIMAGRSAERDKSSKKSAPKAQHLRQQGVTPSSVSAAARALARDRRWLDLSLAGPI
jgi:hypothetical protein